MVIKKWTEKVTEILKKYKYALIILLAGLILMSFPFSSSGKSTSVAVQSLEQTVQPLEERLSQLLSRVEGAGDVEVILTVAAGEEVIYQTNEDSSDSDASLTRRVDTVTVTDSGRNQSGLVRQVKPEVYMGAIIVCRGADNPSVRLAIVEAVSRITGLGANCISVLKMK